MKKHLSKTKILVLVTHTLSEINVLFPMFTGVRSKHDLDIHIVFTVGAIYRAYREDEFYQYCEKSIGIKVRYCHLPNKFDGDLKLLGLFRYGQRISKVISALWCCVKFPYLLFDLITADIYMHEYSNQRQATRVFSLGHLWLKKEIFAYHHGNEVSLNRIATGPVAQASRTTLLVFHQHNARYMEDMGYRRRSVIGYPVFYPEWVDLVHKYSPENSRPGSIVVIYSRHITDLFMDPDTYEYLLNSAIRIVSEKLGKVPIIVKPHPREDRRTMQHIIENHPNAIVEISNQHPAVLARNAKFAIGFWGSVVLESLSMNVPTVEYYIEAKRFREVYPKGSNYKAVGIDSASSEIGLENFIDSVVTGQYKVPDVVKELTKVNNLEVFGHTKS